MTMNKLLLLNKVCKSYEGPAGAPAVSVLDNLELVVDHSQSLSVFGPSGSGKSTLLNLIGALDRPTSGSILFDGANLAEFSDDALADFRNQRIGIIFQRPHLLPQLTLLENVLLPAMIEKDPTVREELQKRAIRLLDRVGLSGRTQHTPHELSGGEQQRCAVVRALINRPSLLLADEPTGSLDRRAAEQLITLLMELNEEEQTALIIVSHDEPLMQSVGSAARLVDGTLISG